MRASIQPRTNRTSQIPVELTTPLGKVFAGEVCSAEISLATGTMRLEAGHTIYFGLVAAAEVTLGLGKRHRYFAVTNAAISMQNRRVTVLAEAIREVPPLPVNCANPICRCATDNIPTMGPK